MVGMSLSLGGGSLDEGHLAKWRRLNARRDMDAVRA